MLFRENQTSDDSLLIRYLLGELPDSEAEPLDLASVEDEDFAGRLSAVESDLVDAYVRGELEGATVERFESWFLSSAPRRAKVALAAALLERERTERAFVSRAPRPPSRHRPERSWWLFAAAMLILVPAVYLLVPSLRQKPPEDQLARSRGAIMPKPAGERATPPSSPPESVSSEDPGRLREPSVAAPSVASISFLVAPQTRAGGPIATVSVPPGAGEVTARLQLEFDEFPQYEAVLKDPATDATLWRLGGLRAGGEGAFQTVLVRLPASLLKTRNYSVELAGVSPDSAPEFIGNYVFRAVLE